MRTQVLDVKGHKNSAPKPATKKEKAGAKAGYLSIPEIQFVYNDNGRSTTLKTPGIKIEVNVKK